ncbi:MAG TPA: HEAT repeat domain-containing protein [Rectinemataceae bacterium]|nr:HEAT repeat domain-containing protein [Rectinemataceae bacterium]
MKVGIRATLAAFAALFILVPASLGWSQSQGNAPSATTQGASTQPAQKTVEESYLQSSLETMIIKEQSQAESRDMKMVALQYAKQAIDGGRKNDDIRKSLEFLATETSTLVIRSGGTGRALNDYPDVRAKACDYLADFPSEDTKDALIKVVLADNEPMVLSAAIRSLGKIGLDDNDDVTQSIAYIVNRYDILQPDNSLAFESLVAFERLNDKIGGLKDPSAIRSIIKIAEGNYIAPVRQKASALLAKIKSTLAGKGGN